MPFKQIKKGAKLCKHFSSVQWYHLLEKYKHLLTVSQGAKQEMEKADVKQRYIEKEDSILAQSEWKKPTA